MSYFVERIIIKNRAPFENLDLQLEDKTLNVLTALNGKGKTTILSYIVDAWVEITKESYGSSYEGKESSYYRVSTSLYDIDKTQPSIVYIRFRTNGGASDYLDVRNLGSLEWYERSIPMDDRVPYGKLQSSSQRSSAFKYISDNLRKRKDAQAIFDNNIATYFPSYRFETPNYLNDKFQPTKFSVESKFNGYLNNPLEVMSDIKDIANWIMDVLVDWEINKEERVLENGGKIIIQPEREIWMNIKMVLECSLISKFPSRNVRFGIGRRNNSGSRVSVMEIIPGGDKLYCPSLLNLSSGELAVIAIFAEIIRQSDITFGMVPLSKIHGIVLIDEVDKHLHIQLQKEALPLLFALFPNVQFIVSSHSPFLNMGLYETADMQERTRIVDLDNGGIESSPTSNEVYESAYHLFLNEKNRYASMFTQLQKQMASQERPILITEGKTDIIHLRNAQKRLGRTDVMVDYAELPEGKWSDAELKKYLENISKIPNGRSVIGMFDRDVASIVSEIENNGQHIKTYSPRVHAFCIPVPDGRESYNKISIEFFYKDEDIRREKDGRRLFLNNEIDVLYNKSTNTTIYQRLDVADQKRESNKQIFDEEKMCQIADYIHSKKTFAMLLESDEEFSKDVDYSAFNQIFDRIVEIQNIK